MTVIVVCHQRGDKPEHLKRYTLLIFENDDLYGCVCYGQSLSVRSILYSYSFISHSFLHLLNPSVLSPRCCLLTVQSVISIVGSKIII